MVTLKDAQQLRVPVLPAQKLTIEKHARAAGLSVAAFLRQRGLYEETTAAFDQQAVLELVRVAADLGRLGGLLKLWLVSDEKFAPFDQPRDVRQRVLGLLQRITLTQSELYAAMEKVVRR